MTPELFSLDTPTVFFPVRHHSPAAARLVGDLIRLIRPDIVLIEGPFDFNPQINELALPHQLPIAIYSYTQLESGNRRGAFYPFCVYSPEWQAIQVAQSLEIPIQFIDLPWAKIATDETTSHRYADGHLHQCQYVGHLCEKLGVEDFDTLWDTLFEIDSDLTIQQYLERCHHFCFHLRSMDERDQKISAIDLRREAFMVEQIRQARLQYSGQILVITGGFHSYPLYRQLTEYSEHSNSEHSTPESLSTDFDQTQLNPSESSGGIALTPYSYERLDNLTGYESGMPNPGFYHQIWQQISQDSSDQNQPPYRQVLMAAAKELRQEKQVLSSADLIAVETLARGLALFRNHAQVWRQDLIDGITGALVKEELAGTSHPFLTAIHQIFRGDQRGTLAEGTRLPPLVQDLKEVLKQHDLEPERKAETLNLDLHDFQDLTRSQILHRLQHLGILGYQKIGGTDLVSREDLSEITESWKIHWSPDFEASCIEAAIYGMTLIDATTNRLKERIDQLERNAEAAALILLDLGLMGLTHQLDLSELDLVDVIRSDGDFFMVTPALGHLLYLYSYNDIFQTQGQMEIGYLLAETFQRGLWLLENLGSVEDRNSELLKGLKTLVETFERCTDNSEGSDFKDSSLEDSNSEDSSSEDSISEGSISEDSRHDSNSQPLISDQFDLRTQFNREFFIEVLQRVSREPAQTPTLRGAATAAIWLLGETSSTEIENNLTYFSDPNQLGDFLTGFFSLARNIVQRHPAVMLQINQFVMAYNETEFLSALPGLRLAFSYFTPREKYHIAQNLLQALGWESTRSVATLTVTAEVAAQMMQFEAAVFQVIQQYGLRTPVPFDATIQPPISREPTEPSPPVLEEVPQAEGSSTVSISSEPVHQAPTNAPINQELCQLRWRLILGQGTESLLGGTLEGIWEQRDQAMGFLYDREYGQGRNVRQQDRKGGQEESQLTVPDWINTIHELFPQRTIERLEKDAVERYKLEEIVTNPDVLQRVQPNQTLLKAILRTKHLMNQKVLAIARQLVRRVVEQLMKKLSRPVQSPFFGAAHRQQRSFLKVAKNFDVETTIRRNLKHYNPEQQKLYIQTPYFYSRIRRQVDRWQIIILVDQSGSMVDSVIHASVTAAIFFGLKSIRTHLCLFDTAVVDVTADCQDPVETMMQVQLGGGTDIGQALAYAAELVEYPQRTIVILITDFYEGGPLHRLLSVTQQLTESGVNLLGLAALDQQAQPCYDREVAARMVALGAEVAAMTPGELAEWVAQKVK